MKVCSTRAFSSWDNVSLGFAHAGGLGLLGFISLNTNQIVRYPK